MRLLHLYQETYILIPAATLCDYYSSKGETYTLRPAATLCDYYSSTVRRIYSDLLRRCATTTGLPGDVYTLDLLGRCAATTSLPGDVYTQTCCDAVRLLHLYRETYTLRPAGTLCDYYISTRRRIYSDLLRRCATTTCLLYTSDAADE